MYTFISMAAENPTLRQWDTVQKKDGEVKAQKKNAGKTSYYVIEYLIRRFKGDVIFSVINKYLSDILA